MRDPWLSKRLRLIGDENEYRFDPMLSENEVILDEVELLTLVSKVLSDLRTRMVLPHQWVPIRQRYHADQLNEFRIRCRELEAIWQPGPRTALRSGGVKFSSLALSPELEDGWILRLSRRKNGLVHWNELVNLGALVARDTWMLERSKFNHIPTLPAYAPEQWTEGGSLAEDAHVDLLPRGARPQSPPPSPPAQPSPAPPPSQLGDLLLSAYLSLDDESAAWPESAREQIAATLRGIEVLLAALCAAGADGRLCRQSTESVAAIQRLTELHDQLRIAQSELQIQSGRVEEARTALTRSELDLERRRETIMQAERGLQCREATVAQREEDATNHERTLRQQESKLAAMQAGIGKRLEKEIGSAVSQVITGANMDSVRVPLEQARAVHKFLSAAGTMKFDGNKQAIRMLHELGRTIGSQLRR